MPQQTYSIEELGQRVKASNPQAFGRFSDQEVGQRVLQRKPELQSIISKPPSLPTSTATSTSSQPPQDGFLSSLAKGMAKPFLEVGAAINNVYNAGGNLIKGGFSQEAANQAARDLHTSYNVPLFGETRPAFTGEESLPEAVKKQAGYGMQFGSLLTPVGVQGSVLKTAGSFGLANALGEAGREITENEKFDPYKVGTSATIGALVPLGGALVKKTLNKIPETAWSALLKRTPTEVAKNPMLSKQVAEEGVVGISRQNLAEKFGNKIQDLELQLDDVLKNKSGGTIEGSTIANKLNDLKNTYANVPGEENAVSIIENLQKQFQSRGKIGLLEANQLKRDIYSLIQKSYGKGILEVPAKIDAQKIAASGIKQEIEKVFTEGGKNPIRDINQKMAIYIQAKNAIEKAISRTEGKGIAGTGIGMQDLLLGGIGTAVGGPIGALKLVAAKKISESPAILSGISKQAVNLLKYFENLSPTKKLLMYNALRVFGGEVPASSLFNSNQSENES